MSRRCACGCGRPCTVSEDWASEDCQQKWTQQRWQVQTLPDGEAVTMSALSRIFGIPADLITAWRRDRRRRRRLVGQAARMGPHRMPPATRRRQQVTTMREETPMDGEHIHICVVCQSRQYERAQVCQPCRRRIADDLDEIAVLHPLLSAAAVTLSTEGGIPLRINAVDLSLPAVGGASAVTVHDPKHDQTGEIAVAAQLDSWVSDWIDTRGIGERQPAPTVAVLVHWLSVRLDDECDKHPGIDDFAAEIRRLLAAMRHAVATATPHGIDYAAPCPRCGTQTLRRRVGADWIECETCGRLWGESDYAALVRDTIPADTLLSVAQAALLLGVTRDAVYKRIARGQLEVVHADPVRLRKDAVDTVTRLGQAAA